MKRWNIMATSRVAMGLIAGCFFVLGTGAPTLLAAPLTITEPPDLTPNLAIPDHIGSVDIGVNTVTGSISADYSSGFPDPMSDDADSFEFTVPEGLVVEQVELVISAYQSTDGAQARVRTFSGGTETEFITGDVTFSNLIKPGVGVLGPGNHDLQVHGVEAFDPGPPPEFSGTVSLDWHFNIVATRAPSADVPTVSEWGVAIMALLLLIGGKVYFNRRRAAAA